MTNLGRFLWILGPTLIFTTVVGKDLNWDALNYHYYAGFEALNDRLGQDFMAASLVGYVNPYSHVPFYLMVSGQWAPLLIAVVFATFHCLNLLLVHRLTASLLRDVSDRVRGQACWASVLAAALAPGFLQCVGSSFNDATLSVLVVGGWLAMAMLVSGGAGWLAALSGALLGAASALKMSNVFFALALVPALAFVPGGAGARPAATLRYVVFGGGVALVVTLPWALRLWQEFGNPFFPFFNEWFQSRDMVTDPLKHQRFLPPDLLAAVVRPFKMALPVPYVHSETISPDARFALLLFAACLVSVRKVLQARPEVADVSLLVESRKSASRVRMALSVCLACSWVIWLSSSGNGRYFLPMVLVGSSLLVAAIVIGFESRAVQHKRSRIALASVVALIAFQSIASAQPRWTQLPWGASWFDVHVPEVLKVTPALFLSTDVLSASFLAPTLHPESGLMNVSGAYPLGPDGAGSSRAVRLIKAAGEKGELRSLSMVGNVIERGKPSSFRPESVDRVLRRFDLAVDPTSCETIETAGSMLRVEIRSDDAEPQPPLDRLWFASCRLSPAPGASAIDEQARRRIDTVFDRIEGQCPRLFSPRGLLTEGSGKSWRRSYINSDVILLSQGDSVRMLHPYRSADLIELGSVDAWLRAPQALNCQ